MLWWWAGAWQALQPATGGCTQLLCGTHFWLIVKDFKPLGGLPGGLISMWVVLGNASQHKNMSLTNVFSTCGTVTNVHIVQVGRGVGKCTGVMMSASVPSSWLELCRPDVGVSQMLQYALIACLLVPAGERNGSPPSLGSIARNRVVT